MNGVSVKQFAKNNFAAKFCHLIMNDPQIRQVSFYYYYIVNYEKSKSRNAFQLKDFMEVYNRIAETCFNHCITSFADRKTSDEEVRITIFLFFLYNRLLIN